MANINSIDTQIWGISAIGYGVIVQGLSSIRQCIDIILRTRKLTDPLRPAFGSDISQYIDLPLNVAIPNIKRAIIEAIEMWETRIKVISVRHYLKSISNPVFEITYKLVDEDLIDQVFYSLEDGGITAPSEVELILQAYFPPNPNNYLFQIGFERNASGALPIPPPNGFQALPDLFAWVQTNWAFYGKWFMLSDRIVLYMKSEGITSASLSISVLPLIQIEAPFPRLDPGESYTVDFWVHGLNASPEFPGGFNSPGHVLSWIQQNWGHYADWFIEYSAISGDPIFTAEMSEEFEGDAGYIQYKLIAISNKQGFDAVLNITKN